MELSVREWMIIIGVLLIMAVLLDGYRRVRSERRNRIRVTLTRQAMQRGIQTPSAPVDDEKAPEVSSELPNGGARVIAKARQDEKARYEKPRRDDLPSRNGRNEKRNDRRDEKLHEDLKLDQPVPVLMESVHIAPLQEEIEPEPKEPLAAEAFADDHDAINQDGVERDGIELDRAERDEVAADMLADDVGDHRIEPSYPTDSAPEPASKKTFFRQKPSPEPVPPPVQAEPAPLEARYFESRILQNSALPNSAAQEVMVVNVISKDAAGFKGQDLLQILLACDLRFGNMNIFHRYEKANGKGAVQFSVANLVEPGTFDLDRIDSFSTPGLCFFLALPGPEKAITAFNYMVETAQVLVKNLHGELRDEGQSVMTQQTIEHYRQRIRDFERKQLTLHL